ncbi:fibronectin type III domain-containing protein 4 isoform X2 [Egretta garzetta]|uniref:fibronectin type III domain-containing protein 4 isoform X2 n=1 Tax=Egretta garzetta TaxID=188379 RepID=UPI00163D34C0|nr:fibronectin type III domain-containing protein 4 isoform X2 [Egretta garzetta]
MVYLTEDSHRLCVLSPVKMSSHTRPCWGEVGHAPLELLLRPLSVADPEAGSGGRVSAASPAWVLFAAGDITMEGLDKDRQLQTGEIIIIVAVLLMWAAVIALFCRQYDIIKDNDSNNNKEKTKPSSEHSTPERPSGGLLRSKKSPSVNIIEV